MVKGLDKFREYFKDFPEQYIIIGGTACDIIIEEAGLTARATKDIDIVLVIEVLNKEFVRQFWKFIKDGVYEKCEQSTEHHKHYRFLKPSVSDFPLQVELFSRVPDYIDLDEDVRLTPIPANDDISSLSAILMDEYYYNFTLSNSVKEGGLHRANAIALICLKAKAFLNLVYEKEKGEHVNDKNIRKHKTDIFRLALMLTPSDEFYLPASIKSDLEAFALTVKDDLPDKSMFNIMGAANTDVNELFLQFMKNFNINL